MNLLRYVHVGPHAAKTQDLFVFHLEDGKNQSPPQHFHISVKELKKGTAGPLISGGLHLLDGSRSTLCPKLAPNY